MFWLQNKYQSGTLKPKNQFYLYFGYKVDTNKVLLNKTYWDPNLKVHLVVPFFWSFTNPDTNPNRSQTEISYNLNVADFDKSKNSRPDWT